LLLENTADLRGVLELFESICAVFLLSLFILVCTESNFWGHPRIDTGGEVNFPAQNERMQFQNKHRFRLRHQYPKWASTIEFKDLQPQ
jgi:hypothetical protein